MILGLISIIISIMCVGIVVILCGKNERLILETKEAKTSYLGARSNLFIMEDDYSVMKKTLQDTFKLNKELKTELIECKDLITEQSKLIVEQRDIIHTYSNEIQQLREDTSRIKRRLKLYDDIAPSCVLTDSFKTSI